MTKRVLDLIMSALLLILCSPIMIIISLVLLFKHGRPIFFRQDRPGMNDKPFHLIKFRTMLITSDADGELLPDDQRMTKYGSFLRNTSLDELPTLINVLRGDMSLVGPRPLLMEYLLLYNTQQKRRHNVKPGITGWAQINGRNNISWDEKFKLDIWYVDNFNLLLDLKILFLTIFKVFFRKDIKKQGFSTTNKFEGSIK